MPEKFQKIEVGAMTTDLVRAATTRARQQAMDRSTYVRLLIIKDCEEAGLWPPPKPEQR